MSDGNTFIPNSQDHPVQISGGLDFIGTFYSCFLLDIRINVAFLTFLLGFHKQFFCRAIRQKLYGVRGGIEQNVIQLFIIRH